MSTNFSFGTVNSGGPFGSTGTSPMFKFGIPGRTQVSSTPIQTPAGGLKGNTSGGAFGNNADSVFGNFSFGPTLRNPHGSPTNGIFDNKANLFPVNSNTNGGFSFGSNTNGTTGGIFGTAAGGVFDNYPFGSTPFSNPTGGVFGNTTRESVSCTNGLGYPGVTGGFSFGNLTPGGGLFGDATGGTMSMEVATPISAKPFRPFTTYGAPPAGGGSGYDNNGLGATPGPTGTAIYKHTPVVDVDDTSTPFPCVRLQCITCMCGYAGKSLEELRMEDYAAGRRGSKHSYSTLGYGASSMGSTTSTTSGSPGQLFGQNPNSASIAAGSTTGGFGTYGANVPSSASNTCWPSYARNPVWPSSARNTVRPSSARNTVGPSSARNTVGPSSTRNAVGPSSTRNTANHGAANPGTSLVKYVFITGHDDTPEDLPFGWPLTTRLHCITFMDAYQGKSLEELRLEDYAAGRKGRRPGEMTTSETTGLLESIEELWRCPVCLEQATPPLQMCKNGHIYCKKCCVRLTSCPVCRVRFSKVPARAVEQVMELLPKNRLP